jgi:transcriptional regulator with XRE-family HTH domain
MASEADRQALAFGRVLRRVRKARGISQEALAYATGLDRTFISLLERGLRQPSLGTLLRIGDALKLPLTTLAHEIEHELGAAECQDGPNKTGNLYAQD